MYREWAHDLKFQALSETLQRRYIMVLCMQAEDLFEPANDDEVACYLRITLAEWKETETYFLKKKILDKPRSIHGWSKRQYLDTTNERMRVYRANKKEKIINNTSSLNNYSSINTDNTEAKTVTVTQRLRNADAKPKKTNKEIKTFIDWFFAEHANRGFGKYIVTAKDAAQVSRMLGTITLDELKSRAESFLADAGSWPAGDKGICAFARQINRYGKEKPVSKFAGRTIEV